MLTSLILQIVFRQGNLVSSSAHVCDSYSGVPQFSGASPLYHDVDVTLHHGQPFNANKLAPVPKTTWTTVSTLTRFYVPKGGQVFILLPCYLRGGNENPIHFIATVDKHPIHAVPMMASELQKVAPSFLSNASSSERFELINIGLPKGQHSLRVAYSEYIEPKTTSVHRKSFLYALGNGPTLTPIQVAFHYDQSIVFDLPALNVHGAQIGTTGAFWEKKS